MRRFIQAVAIATLAAVTATAAIAAPKLVYRVDKVTAAIVKGHLVVSVSGAVPSGGWTVPRLHMKEGHVAESDTEIFEFLAAPPLSNSVVIQALLPVTATAVFPLPRYATVKVKVEAESNNLTAPIR